MRWLHDDDSLRVLSEEEGLIADWAHLQRLARGGTGPVPTRPGFAVVGALLATERPAGWEAEAFGGTPNLADFGLAVADLGLSLGGDAVAGIRAHLAGPWGAEAADLLVLLGALEPADLRTLVDRFPEAPTLPAWLVAASGDVLQTASALTPMLLDDLAAGGRRLEASVALLLGVPDTAADAYAGLLEGRRAAGGTGELPVVRGSTRRQVAKLASAWVSELPEGVGALLSSVLTAPKGPALTARLAWSTGFWSHTEGPAPGTRVLQEGYRLDGPLPLEPHRSLALALQVQAARHPAHAAALLDRSDTRDLGLFAARFALTEDVLERLLVCPVPASPIARADLALALAATGTPAAVPNLRGVLEHVAPGEREVALAWAEGLLGRPVTP